MEADMAALLETAQQLRRYTSATAVQSISQALGLAHQRAAAAGVGRGAPLAMKARLARTSAHTPPPATARAPPVGRKSRPMRTARRSSRHRRPAFDALPDAFSPPRNDERPADTRLAHAAAAAGAHAAAAASVAATALAPPPGWVRVAAPGEEVPGLQGLAEEDLLGGEAAEEEMEDEEEWV